VRLASRVRTIERRLSPTGTCACGLMLVDTTSGEAVPKDTTCGSCGRPKLVVIMKYDTKPPLAKRRRGRGT
jgi:hypothetical protein